MDQSLVILIPVYEDWEAFGLLLEQLDRELSIHSVRAAVLAVDDASLSNPPKNLSLPGEAITSIDALTLKTNLGHQRAIAIGLAYLHYQGEFERVIVMDGDGEDRPRDIDTLLTKSAEANHQKVIFAERARRSESQTFRKLYAVYRFLFRILTGHRIRFGNFSLVPASLLGRIVWLADIWNNYAAALVKARIPISTVPCDRGTRVSGESKMNLVGLIVHGLSAISVYNEIVGARALIASIGMMMLALALGVTATVVKFSTDLAIPGWATYAVGLSLIGVLQALSLTVFFVFLILHGRNSNPFVAGRDYASFIAGKTEIYQNKTD